MGGKLKFAEFTSGRFADVLSNLYLGYAVLWYQKKHPVADAQDIIDYAMQTILHDIEEAFDGIFQNFPLPFLGVIMKALTFPTGRCYNLPKDRTVSGAANAITTKTDIRDLIASDLFISSDPSDRVAMICNTMGKAIEADAIYADMRRQRRQPTADEKSLLDEVEAAREIIIQVDSFKGLGQELNGTRDWTPAERPAYRNAVNMAAVNAI